MRKARKFTGLFLILAILFNTILVSAAPLEPVEADSSARALSSDIQVTEDLVKVNGCVTGFSFIFNGYSENALKTLETVTADDFTLDPAYAEVTDVSVEGNVLTLKVTPFKSADGYAVRYNGDLLISMNFTNEDVDVVNEVLPDLGPKVVYDPDSPTGYTGQFAYLDEEAEQVYFCGDLNLSNHADPSDTKVYSPFEFKPGMMRRGGSQFKEPMQKLENGYWYYELPLTAGANQYWFNVDNGRRMMPDPENHPEWSPGSNWNTKDAYNAIYVPYHAKQNYAPLAARAIENPRTDDQVGTWSYVPIEISGTTRYMGVYLPYGYDADRSEPYKLIYMLHGMGQDESDWMGIGSVQNILDNLIANGETEPAVLVSLGSAYFGSNFANLFNTIMPFVEENYNVSGEAEDQSFAGLSMGAMNTSSIIRQDSSKFKYYGLFSGAQVGNIIQGSNLDQIYMLIGDGLYENGQSEANLNNLTNSGANYDYLRVAGAHDFNTWCQLFTTYARDYLWKPEAFEMELGPKVVEDPDSPTGYTGQFVYYNNKAEQVYFCGDLMLSNHANPEDTAVYSPFDYKPGMMRRGGSQFKEPMQNLGNGYWYYELPLTAGANQYWFNVDDGTRMLPDPANHPQWSPGSNWDTKNAYNAIYVPYSEKQDYAPLAARVVENPRTDGQVGTWSYVPFDLNGKEEYVGVYLPYGYDADRAEPYKTIYMQHGGGQDESDWMGIGSVQNIMDNLLADGLTEPAIIVTTDSKDLGNAADGYPNLFNVILPFIEENYNVSTKVADRSFAGLSMGAGITTSIINYDITKFKYYGVFSGGDGSRVADAENLGSAYILFGNGQYERVMSMSALEGTDANYDYLQFAGAHDFNTWCQLFTTYVRDYLWKPEAFGLKEGPKVVKDPDSPTGYTGQFVYKNADAEQVYFCGDLMLSNHANPEDTTIYSPFEYKPGMMRRGGAQFKEPMQKIGDGLWYYELPLTAGANQYWFNVDDGTRMLPDPANHPQWSPGSNWNTKNAYNAIYVPYDEKQDYAPLAARVVENPRTDGQVGTWSYVPFDLNGKEEYVGVYLPYGYDADRAEPYKTIYMQHGGGQDESDWMGIGSVQNIMDNLLADGLTEPAIIVTTDSKDLGNAAEGYPNLFNVILPFIEENYNVSTKVADRSFAGLSMGGMITTRIINYDITKFKYYGVFSGGAGSAVANANNLGSAYILFGNGQYEGFMDMSALEGTDANYDYLQFAGAHDFNTWCQLFTTYVRDYLWKPEAFEIKAGPRVVKDPDSPTGYTGQFVYFDDQAEQVYFCGDLMLSNHADPSDTKVYTPFEYKPGMMRRGGAQFKEPMKNLGNGYWYYELPLAAGANQYWFNVDNGTRMLPDPENHPEWSPGSNWNTKNAYNAIYVPYDEKQDYAPLAAREIENPRTDDQVGTWSYVPVEIAGTTRYMGVYLPYGYDADRAEPYKLIYMLHGAGQDESDWMGIGSVQNILDNLIANGETEPAVLVSLGSAYFGNNFENLFNIIMPYVEDNYNVSGEAKDQSFAGLSMGAMNTSSIIRLDSSKFRYYGLFSGARIANIVQGSNLDQTYMLIGDGLYEGGQSEANLNSLANAGANYDYLRVAGAHDFNTWCQLFTTYVRDYLWKPSSFTDISTGALNYLIEKAEALIAEGALKDTLPAVVTEFNAALQAAKEVADDTSATQADISAASQRLLDAIGMINWKIASKGDLAQAIALAEYITDKLDAYVDAGKAELAAALSAANTIYADENAIQEDVDEAFLNLMDAVTSMRLKADKVRLQELINRAQEIDLSLYTADSVEVLRTVLAKGDAVLADNTLNINDQKVIDLAADELEAAINGLVRLSDNSDKTTDDTSKGDTPKGDTNQNKDSGKDTPDTGSETESSVALIVILLGSALVCELMRRKAAHKHTVK